MTFSLTTGIEYCVEILKLRGLLVETEESEADEPDHTDGAEG